MIELATPDTALFIADNLRDEEVVVKEHGKEAAGDLAYDAARVSVLSFVCRAPDGTPVCMFGADGDPGDDWASAWMFSTARVNEAPIAVVKMVKEAIEFSRDYFPELRIYSEERNDAQKRFLEYIGFRPTEKDGTELRI